MVVRRPASARRFNGTVIVEWYNVSNQYDQEVDWLQTHEHLVREGYAWVGVSAQRAGIHSATGLRAWNPGRYGSLDVTAGGTINDDTLSFDVFTQAARALTRPRGADPLGGLEPRRILATGHSQSAGRLRTYYNSVHPLAGAYDGFVMHGMFGDTSLRTDIATPAWKLQSETDAVGFFGPPTSQPDSEHVLTWEVAGTTHGDWKLIVEHGPLRIRDVGAPPDDYPPNGPTLCAGPTFSRIPFYMTQAAAYDHLDRWARTGRRPPQAPRIPLPVTRDADGNALGGIRLPQFAVPVATDSGSNTGPGFCFLHGVHQPFTQARLDALYPSELGYLAKITKATLSSLRGGYLSETGAFATVADAARFGVPVRGEGALRSAAGMTVYTPPGYDGSHRRYPALYLLGGGWAAADVKAMLDQAINKDAGKPMLVVLPAGDPDDAVEAVERRFRVERGTGGRAAAGGAVVLDTLFRHPGLFGNASVWSTGWSGAVSRVGAVNERTDTLELRIGRDDPAYAAMTAARARLDRHGVNYEYGETPTSDARRYLMELIPRLFRESELIEP
jgi:Alpha/beta hydrolase domain/Putative esterase